MNLNSLLDNWEDPIKDLYLLELEVLTSGICIRLESEKQFREIIAKIIAVEGRPTSQTLLEEHHKYMNLVIFSDEPVEMEILNSDGVSFYKKRFFVRDASALNDLFLKDAIDYIGKELSVKIKISKSSKRLKLEERKYFTNINEYIREKLEEDTPEVMSELTKKMIQKYINRRNYLVIAHLCYQLRYMNDELDNKQINKIDSDLEKEITESMKEIALKREYLTMLKDSCLTLKQEIDDYCIG